MLSYCFKDTWFDEGKYLFSSTGKYAPFGGNLDPVRASEEYLPPINYIFGNIVNMINHRYNKRFDDKLYVRAVRPMKLTPMPIKKQIFKDNEYGICVFDGINSKLQEFLNSNTKDKRKYITMEKKLKLLVKEYPDGVPKDIKDFKYICDKLLCNIKIYNMLGGVLLDCKRTKPNKNTMTFELVNSIQNHVDRVIKNRTEEKILPKELYAICEENIKNKIYQIVYRTSKIYRIETVDKIYTIKHTNELSGIINKFLDNMAKFGNHTCENDNLDNFLINFYKVSGTKSFFNNRPDDIFEFPEIDHSKSYARFKECEYYEGFPALIHYFARVEPDHELRPAGIYMGDLIPPDNNPLELLNSYFGRCTLFAPEIKFLKSLGFTFIPILGAWGSVMEFEWGNEFLEKDIHGMSPYAYCSGRLGMFANKYTKVFYGNKKWAEHIKYLYPDRIDKYYEMGDYNEIPIDFEPYVESHHLHIAGAITSYSRIQVLQQFLELDPTTIIKMNLDGFFVSNTNQKLLKNFRIKPNRIAQLTVSEHYIKFGGFSDEELTKMDIPYHEPEYEGNLHLSGPGGYGKTFWALTNRTYMGILYVCDAKKTCASKHLEYGVNPMVVARMNRDYETTIKMCKFKRHPATIVFDEAPKYHGQIKKIMENFPYSRYIFIADLDKNNKSYQLEDFTRTEPMETLWDKVKHFTTDYRCECEQLAQLKQGLRDIIDDPLYENIRIFKNCFPNIMEKYNIQTITKDELFKKYNRDDYILCCRKSCDEKIIVHTPKPDCKLSYLYKICKEKHDHTDECFENLCPCEKYDNERKIRCGRTSCNHDTLLFNKELEYYTDIINEQTGIKKYMFIKSDTDNITGKKYNYGDIVYEIPNCNKSSYEARHAFTVHQVQGETITTNIFIDDKNFWNVNMYYVAISRAKKLNQIYIIRN